MTGRFTQAWDTGGANAGRKDSLVLGSLGPYYLHPR